LKKTTNHSQPGIAWQIAKKFSLSAIFVDFGGQGNFLAIHQKIRPYGRCGGVPIFLLSAINRMADVHG